MCPPVQRGVAFKNKEITSCGLSGDNYNLCRISAFKRRKFFCGYNVVSPTGAACRQASIMFLSEYKSGRVSTATGVILVRWLVSGKFHHEAKLNEKQ